MTVARGGRGGGKGAVEQKGLTQQTLRDLRAAAYEDLRDTGRGLWNRTKPSRLAKKRGETEPDLREIELFVLDLLRVVHTLRLLKRLEETKEPVVLTTGELAVVAAAIGCGEPTIAELVSRAAFEAAKEVR